MAPEYRGRFAPSPTGPLHFGSLVAALASYLDAKAHGGQWLVRMEDVDLPRCKQEFADEILRQLEAYGLEWDGPVAWQSQRGALYESVLDSLRANGALFPCGCTRQEAGDRYPGTCRQGLAPGRAARSWRLRVSGETIAFQDRLQGWYRENLAETCGDFVLKRADGLYAYQLAVVVDDAEQGITHVVRGADLLDSTARQIWLQRQINAPTPAYLHIPVVLGADGQKLSKQTLAEPIDTRDPQPAKAAALEFLRQAGFTASIPAF